MIRATAMSALAAGAALTISLPSTAASNSYVALGDSYSAGVGTRAKVDSCYRSSYGYPALIATAKGLSLNYQACSGATTTDVQNNQLGALSSGTAYVTMTIGGNDLGFTSVLTTCAQPSWMSDCSGAIAKGRNVLTGALPGRYDSLFGAIRAKAPNARVVIGGYPHIFNGQDCNLLTFFSPSEESSLNSATDDLDSLIATKARSRGFGVVDPRGAFGGHAVCDSTEWINGLSNPIEESYHPNRLGNSGYATLFAPALTGSAMKAAAQPNTRKLPGAIVVPQVDLTSAKSLRGAAKVGISAAELRRLQRQLHSGDNAEVTRALTRLKALDRMAERKLAHSRPTAS